MTKGQSAVLIVVALLVLGGLIWLASEQPAVAPDTETNGDSPAETATSVDGEVDSIDNQDQVVNEEGEPTDTSAAPDSENAPEQSDPVSEGEVPEEAIQLGVSSNGFNPSEFSVQSGAAVTIAVTSEDDQTHIFKFRDEEMQGVAVGVAPGETRVVSFNAPAPGQYEYYCDVPGHDGRGENGVMTVE